MTSYVSTWYVHAPLAFFLSEPTGRINQRQASTAEASRPVGHARLVCLPTIPLFPSFFSFPFKLCSVSPSAFGIDHTSLTRSVAGQPFIPAAAHRHRLPLSLPATALSLAPCYRVSKQPHRAMIMPFLEIILHGYSFFPRYLVSLNLAIKCN